ncbi:unnamed protein product [Sphenostylis stenocarpa]|uniref:HTH myb-type domain-containing protein n=1 Tax=Sphenostylis stenocarpa TaxID=92480 RepID=A0AA86TDR0_9FABA|nr:unnamed protein product [Sphenostylis stenocarpa]
MKFGKGHWTSIARYVLLTKTRSQIASHAQKHFLHLRDKEKKKRSSIHDINLENDFVLEHVKKNNHPIQPLYEVHQAREIMGLQNDNLVPHNPIEQIHQNLQPQQLAIFEDNLAFHHIQQQSLPPSKVQQLPHHIDQHDLAPVSDILQFSSNNYINQEGLQDLWVTPLYPQNQQFSHFIDQDGWAPSSNQ